MLLFSVCLESQNGGAQLWEVAGGREGWQPPQPQPGSLLTPTGSHYFRAAPLPPLCFSVLNNFPTCHATCCPVSHVAAGTVWQKQLLLTLSHCHGICYPTSSQHFPWGHLLFLTCPLPLLPQTWSQELGEVDSQPPGAGQTPGASALLCPACSAAQINITHLPARSRLAPSVEDSRV